MDNELDALETIYGFRPDPSRDNWKIHNGNLFVANADHPPRIYRRGCKGVYVEVALRQGAAK